MMNILVKFDMHIVLVLKKIYGWKKKIGWEQKKNTKEGECRTKMAEKIILPGEMFGRAVWVRKSTIRVDLFNWGQDLKLDQ